MSFQTSFAAFHLLTTLNEIFFLGNLKANEIFQAMTNLKGDCHTIEANASRSMVRVLTRRQLMVQDAGWPLACLALLRVSLPPPPPLLLLRHAQTKKATEGLRCWPLCLLLALLKVLPPTSSSFSDRQIQTDRHICTNFLELVLFSLILGAFTLT